LTFPLLRMLLGALNETLVVADRHDAWARVRMRQGDSDLGVASASTVASRSTVTAGTAIVRAAETVIRKAKKLASDALEAAEADLVYEAGSFVVAGTDRRIAEVEIDPETGAAALAGYTAVDDCANVLDHMVVEGQVHGALVQGLGQALLEHLVYDRAGQLLTGSFMDYAHADDVPQLTAAEHGVPATTNPLGVKGVGEAGTAAALAAIMNAIAEALPGAAHMDMPATAEKIWAACRGG
jgi:aerobic carbon-monoxide dehydrogenase large subunit